MIELRLLSFILIWFRSFYISTNFIVLIVYLKKKKFHPKMFKKFKVTLPVSSDWDINLHGFIKRPKCSKLWIKKLKETSTTGLFLKKAHIFHSLIQFNRWYNLESVEIAHYEFQEISFLLYLVLYRVSNSFPPENEMSARNRHSHI